MMMLLLYCCFTFWFGVCNIHVQVQQVDEKAIENDEKVSKSNYDAMLWKSIRSYNLKLLLEALH